MLLHILLLSALFAVASAQPARCFESTDCTGAFIDGPFPALNRCLAEASSNSYRPFQSPGVCRFFGTCYDDGNCAGNVVIDPSLGVDKTIFGRCVNNGESFLPFDTNICNNAPGVDADPHFATFGGGRYDFQGECDLALIRNPHFANGTGLDIHIRTTRYSFFSFVEVAAVKIGEHTLEIDNKAVIKVNGVSMAAPQDKASLTTFAGYPVTHDILHNKGGTSKVTHVLGITLGDSESIKFHVWDMFVGVFVNHRGRAGQEATTSLFRGSLGMMGDFGQQGLMVARDGETVVEDPVAFAAEWQVRNDGTDHILFAEARLPQHPQACFLPEATERELVSDAARMAAEKACEHWGGKGKEACIYDVIATGNLDIADAEVY